MSKKSKKKHIENESINENNNSLSKKELYDLKQKEKKEQKNKTAIKNNKHKKKKKKKTYKTNLAGRIFAIVMLILMVGSVVATISYYFSGAN